MGQHTVIFVLKKLRTLLETDPVWFCSHFSFMFEPVQWQLDRIGSWWLLLGPVKKSAVSEYPLGLSVFWPWGSRFEPDDVQGVTHFLEHVMFKKPSVFNKLRILEAEGVQINAYTTHEHVSLEMEGLSGDWRRFLDFVFDLAYGFEIESSHIELEKQVIIQEILGQKDDPYVLLEEVVFQRCFPSHPLAHPITGTVQSVKRFSLDGLKSFFRLFFEQSPKILALTGAFSSKDVLMESSRLTTKYEKRILSAPNIPLPDLRQTVYRLPARQTQVTRQMQKGRKRKKMFLLQEMWAEPIPSPEYKPFQEAIEYQSQQVYLGWVWPAPSLKNEDRLKMYLFQQWFSEGMTSYLYEELREKRGLVYEIFSDYMGFLDTGVFLVSVSCEPDKVVQVTKTLKQLVDDLQNWQPSSVFWRRLKKLIRTQFWLNQGRAQALASLAGLNLLYHGEVFDGARILRQYSRISLQRWISWLRSQMVWSKVSPIVVGPNAKSLLESILSV